MQRKKDYIGNAFLVGIFYKHEEIHEEHQDYLLEELENLTKSANFKIAGKEKITRTKIDVKFYLGKGNTKEIGEKAKEAGAEFLIISTDISPAQKRNIEKETGLTVIDRTELIIHIFVIHARSKEAKLQAELAQMEYELTHLVRKWSHFGKITGGGVTTRGMGETQLEVDKRLTREKIALLKKKLKKRENTVNVQSKKRHNAFNISLIGYTNAGKSTIFNKLTKSGVYTANQLFATLDTTSRQFFIDGRIVILNDTIGFITNLPHQLIASFKTTLSDVTKSNILLHIVDINDPFFEKHMDDVDQILKELDAEDIPRVTVYNKIDKMTGEEKIKRLEAMKQSYPNSLFISAKKDIGIDELYDRINDFIPDSIKTIYENA